jgi:bifunctional DNA-binding transcriptional regulator/antitoxin component of YhaV-PrlF toxin-antitoxin module
MLLTSKTRGQGGSVTTTVPAEVIRKLGLRPGDELYWVDDGAGGYHVTPLDPETQAMLEAHEEVIREYRDVFAALAK